MQSKNKITPFLMFAGNAEHAINFYKSIFEEIEISEQKYYPENTPERGGKLMSAKLDICGNRFYISTGGEYFRFAESFSFMVECDSQEEIDRFWEALSDGGTELACGWVKDKYGLCWQIVPSFLLEALTLPESGNFESIMQAMMPMKKIIIADLGYHI